MIDDDTCIDTMTYHVVVKESLHQLTAHDKKLLIEYAAEIFNVYKNRDYQQVMQDTAVLIHNYRNGLMGQKFSDSFMKNYPPTPKNYSHDEMQRVMKKKATELRQLLGGNSLTPKPAKLLKDELEKVICDPSSFIITKPKVSSSKKEIQNYLTSLKLDGKSQIIQEFIKAIR